MNKLLTFILICLLFAFIWIGFFLIPCTMKIVNKQYLSGQNYISESFVQIAIIFGTLTVGFILLYAILVILNIGNHNGKNKY